MWNKLIVSLVFLMSFAASAQLSDLDVGSKSRNIKAYNSQTDEQKIAEMKAESAKMCNNDGCTIASRTFVEKGWSFGCNAGSGQSNQSGNNYYINTDGGQSGAVTASFGCKVEYRNIKCTSAFKIGAPQFENFMRYAYEQRGDSSSTDMKALTSDSKFINLVLLELYKQLGASGCSK